MLRLFAVDTRSFVLFRMALGLTVIADALLRMRDLQAHYSDDGLLPRSCRLMDLGASSWAWSFHFVNGSTAFNGALLLFIALIGVCIVLGKHTRICCLIGWLMMVSLQLRTPGVNTGGDATLRLLLFWMIFIPFSQPKAFDGKYAPAYLASVGTMGLMLQVVLLYWVTAIVKSHPVWRQESTAIEWSLGIESFQGPLAQLALGFPDALRFLTQLTLWIEEVGPMLALLPFRFGRIRTLAVLGMIAFHLLGIGLTLRLGIFPWVSALSWLIFLPPYFWELLASMTSPSMKQWIGEQFTRWKHPAQEARPRERAVAALALMSILYAVWWNVASTVPRHWGAWMPQKIKHFGFALGLNQNWLLFAPRPATRDGWYVASAKLDDGRIVDPLHEGKPVSFDRPRGGIAAEYQNCRWHRLLHGMFYSRFAGEVTGFGEWVKRDWEKRTGTTIHYLEIHFMLIDPWHPEDGLRKVKVYPFHGIDAQGRALFEGDLRWDAEQGTPVEPASKKTTERDQKSPQIHTGP